MAFSLLTVNDKQTFSCSSDEINPFKRVVKYCNFSVNINVYFDNALHKHMLVITKNFYIDTFSAFVCYAQPTLCHCLVVNH